MDCLFCKIVAGQLPATKIFENEKILGFKDIQPKADVHYLFVTKEHFHSLADIPAEKMSIMTDLFLAVKDVTEKDNLVNQGYKTVIHTGAGGGQIVFHLHVHLLSNGKL